MAESAMSKLQSAKGRLQCLMLANLACVVLLRKDTLTGSDTWGKMTATFSAAGIEFSDEGLAA